MAQTVITGATGTIGRALTRALTAAGRPGGGAVAQPRPRAGRRWAMASSTTPGPSPSRRPRPPQALAGADAVIHLLGEPIAQRWNARGQARDRGVARALHAHARPGPARRCPRPTARRVLVSQSATGYYGPHGDEPRRGGRAAPATTSWPGWWSQWEREARRDRRRDARRVHADRRRALAQRRRAGHDAAVLSPRSRRARGRRAPVRPLDPSRRRRRGAAALRHGLLAAGPGQRDRAQPGDQPRAHALAGAARCTARRSSRSRRRRCTCSTARWPRW